MTVSINGTSGLVFNDASTQNTSAFYGGLAFRNRIINGAMVISQRGTSAFTQTTSTTYSLDRWGIYGSGGSQFTAQQLSATPPAGFKNYLGVVNSASPVTPSGTQEWDVFQYVEGFNTADLGWGAAGAATVTLSFWVRSSVTGSFGGQISNYNATRSYPFSYTISAANTWEQKTITIAGDTTGTWNTDNTIGIGILFSLGAGSTKSGTANTWAGANYVQPTGSVALVATASATWQVTGVQLEKGSTATSFDYRPYGTELALCQRYLQIVGAGVFGTKQSNDASIWYGMYYPKVSFRVKPTSAVVTAAIKLDYPGTANYTQSSANAAIAVYASADAVALQCANFTSLVAFSNLVIRDDGGVIQLGAEL